MSVLFVSQALFNSPASLFISSTVESWKKRLKAGPMTNDPLAPEGSTSVVVQVDSPQPMTKTF